MTPEDISFAHWQFEQYELGAVKEAMRQAESGRLVPHATVKQLFKLRQTPTAPVAPPIEMSRAAQLSWSDAALGRLRSTCETLEHGEINTQSWLSQIFSAVELICKNPGLGRSGRVQGTREWCSAMAFPTIVYRELRGEIQVLAVLVSRRKWPHMKTASV
jgi:plasmid stabilization system protein ParE